MTTPNGQSNPVFSEAEFVELYGECKAILKDGTVADFTINDALEVEAAMCQGKPEKRTDPKARLKKLGRFVGEAALLPEHRWLLVEEEK